MTEDKRVRRTQKLLGEALIAEAIDKGYKNITIQDVTTRADVGYRTFFRHYSGLDELLINLAEDRLDDFFEILDLPQPADLTQNPLETFHLIGVRLFQHVQENQTNMKFLLLDDSFRFVFEPVIENAQKRLESLLSLLPQGKISPALAANHIIRSVFSLIRWWLENDLQPSPEEMADILTNLVIQPTWLVFSQVD